MVAGKGSQPDGAERRLQELGIKLPTPSTPFGTYAETVQTGNLLFFSGMLPVVDHKPSILAGLGRSSMSRPAAMQPTSRR
jgi:enamine deaminase RidA (YjgF/YER057c/UK114 family)